MQNILFYFFGVKEATSCWLPPVCLHTLLVRKTVQNGPKRAPCKQSCNNRTMQPCSCESSVMHAPKATRSKSLDGRLPASMLRRQMTSRRSVHKRNARSMSCGCPSHCIEPSHDRSNGMAKSGAATNRTAANKCASRVGTGFGTMRSEVKSEAFHRRAASCKAKASLHSIKWYTEARHASARCGRAPRACR